MEKKFLLITLAFSFFMDLIAQVPRRANFVYKVRIEPDPISRWNKPDKQPEMVKTLEERKIEAIRQEEEKRIEAIRQEEEKRIEAKRNAEIAKKEKIEKAKQMQRLYNKYGKKYVDSLKNNEILIGAPESLIIDLLSAKLISEGKQTRVYDVYAFFRYYNEWKPSCRVDVDISTRRVRHVFYY